MSLQHALEALYGLERRRDKHDLGGTHALMRALGEPHQRFRSVHVAGTNGKGSVCALIERVLREAGHRTGLFTSPHLVDFRERIRVNGRWADEAWLERKLAQIASLPEGRDRTFFEVCTALAFDYFAEHGVEIAVVEVGLGGRLDCTNVITPEVSVITSVDYDHTEILGDTIEEIAAEKAGIIKPGVPVVENVVFTSARGVIRETAERNDAPLAQAASLVRTVPTDDVRRVAFATGRWDEVRFDVGPGGVFKHINAGTAIAALEILANRGWSLPRDAVQRGCEQARWPGRCEPSPTMPRLWWDGAHNREGMQMLKRVWEGASLPPPAAVVLAASADKPLAVLLDTLADLSDRCRLIVTRCRHARAWSPEDIARLAFDGGQEADVDDWWEGGWRAEIATDVPTACRLAMETGHHERPVLLTGSLFAVGEAMEAFGGAPGEML